ncbi:MAG: DUF3679 domain-containing protein [Bacillota bacterium]|nr:DUF3679 domain-containing protein [Bacillota bacterium]
MRIFIFKSFLLISLVFISVLAGIQMANNGIHHIKGYSLTEKGSQLNDISISANDSFSHDLQAKKEKLEKINSFNLFSSVGKKVSDGISNASVKIINSMVN